MTNILSNIWFVAAIWMGLALIASIVSIRLKVSVALIEILVGVHQTTDWINFLAMLGSGVITFLAGAEIDPVSLKANLRPSLVIGILSFLLPFALVWAFAQFILGWSLHQAQIAGIALSTTSVAVVYAVMIETGHSTTALGKMILAACFITDFGTVLALGVLFASFNWWMLLFVGVLCLMLWYMPRWTNFIISRMGAHQISEPEVKFLLLVLFFLGGLSTTAKSEAVLPAYLVGLVVAGVFMRDKTLVHRMRSIAFAVFTPFYFLKAGLYVSLPAVWSALGVISFLFLLKLGSKYIGVFPFARVFSMRSKESHYTTLLMGTGLTFGTIASLYGLNNHILNQKQYTILVTVVILSAVLPTLLAQKYFKPSPTTMDAWGRLRKRRDAARLSESLKNAATEARIK
ncbi:MAG TPA: cation:proton antiporter [Puia sp.]|uniref:cation:proton antiporter n=1 Tax=Puia sp. TaxID=2045100 RepID=UPI002BEBC1DB|nr:cation:proton antiporter [Puia sp.]HVU93699.1 cation:proton antiporter [Puia sp.]